MAEGFLRARGGDRFVAESAGTVAGGLPPLAILVMGEIGIDISGQRSRSVDEVDGRFDVCVTVCDANCPIPPRAGLQLRWEVPDPALAGGTEAERLAAFRRVRDSIGDRVQALIRSGMPGAPVGRTVGSQTRRSAGGRVMPELPQGLPPRPGEVVPPGAEQGSPGGMPIDRPSEPQPRPTEEPKPTM